MTRFIRKEFHVEEADKVRVIHQDDAPARPGAAGGVLYIIGLQGCGKSALARRLAEALGGAAASLPLAQHEGGAEAALEKLLSEAHGAPLAVEVPHKLLASDALRARMQATGRVLYLMAGVEAIAARLATSPEEEDALRQRLGRQRAAFEPLFMQSLHLIAPADGPLDEVLADVLERVRM